LDYDDVKEHAKNFPSKQVKRFIEWFTYSDETIDEQDKTKAYLPSLRTSAKPSQEGEGLFFYEC